MEGDKKGKVNDMFRDYDDDYGDRVILTCFKNLLSEYFQNGDANKNLELENDNDSISELESVSSMPELIDHDYEAEESANSRFRYLQ